MSIARITPTIKDLVFPTKKTWLSEDVPGRTSQGFYGSRIGICGGIGELKVVMARSCCSLCNLHGPHNRR